MSRLNAHLVLCGALVAWLLVGQMSSAQAQDIEPRAFSNAPIGVNFLIVGYGYTRGGLAFDSSAPVTDPQLETSSAVLGYARVLDLWGQSGKVDVVVPYSWLSGTAESAGQPLERIVDGFSDPRFRLSVNLLGAPALRLEEFGDYTERTWVFRKAGCVPRASGQGTPTRRSGPYGEEA